MAVLEHLVSALNIFLRSAAMNCRMRLCRLGEELLPSILYVWADMRPSPALKEEIVEFFNLQICVHHPKGAKTQDTGSSFKNFILNVGFQCLWLIVVGGQALLRDLHSPNTLLGTPSFLVRLLLP